MSDRIARHARRPAGRDVRRATTATRRARDGRRLRRGGRVMRRSRRRPAARAAGARSPCSPCSPCSRVAAPSFFAPGNLRDVVMQQRAGPDHRRRHDARDPDRPGGRVGGRVVRACARSLLGVLAQRGRARAAGGARRDAARRGSIGLANGRARRRAAACRRSSSRWRCSSILRDGLRWATDGAWVRDLPAAFQWFGLGQAAGEALIIGAHARGDRAGAWLLRHHAAGRAVYATGSDAESARLAGLSPDRCRRWRAFAVCGLLTGLAAVLNAMPVRRGARRDRRRPRDEGHRRRDRRRHGRSRAAAVRSLGTVIGVALLGAIGTGLTFLGVSAYWEHALQGAIILAAICSRSAPRRRAVRAPSHDGAHRPRRSWRWRASLAAEIGDLRADRAQLRDRRQRRRDRAARRGGRAAGAGADAGRRHGRHRPVVRRAARPGGRHVGRAVARCRLVACRGGRGGALAVGALGGALNGWLIARWSLPPLMVTLGSLSLFRGLAEGLTGGVDNYTGLPASLPVARAGLSRRRSPRRRRGCCWSRWRYWRAAPSHDPRAARTSRSATTPAASRHAGAQRLQAARRALRRLGARWPGWPLSSTSRTWVRPRPTRAPATSSPPSRPSCSAARPSRGGVGTIVGTILGLPAMVVLQNGLRLAALPAELAGVLTGVLLIGAIGAPRVARAAGATRPAEPVRSRPETTMRNSQLAVLCGVILASGGLVAGTNWWLVRSLQHGRLARLPRRRLATPAAAARVVVGMMPKAKGDPYFVSCRRAPRRPRARSGVDLIWDGPTELDPAKQNEVVEAWITRGVNVVAVSVENQAAISTVLRKARGARHQGADLGRRLGARRARLPDQPGDAAGHRRDADRRSRAARSAAPATSRSSPRR